MKKNWNIEEKAGWDMLKAVRGSVEEQGVEDLEEAHCASTMAGWMHDQEHSSFQLEFGVMRAMMYLRQIYQLVCAVFSTRKDPPLISARCHRR